MFLFRKYPFSSNKNWIIPINVGNFCRTYRSYSYLLPHFYFPVSNLPTTTEDVVNCFRFKRTVDGQSFFIFKYSFNVGSTCHYCFSSFVYTWCPIVFYQSIVQIELYYLSYPMAEKTVAFRKLHKQNMPYNSFWLHRRGQWQSYSCWENGNCLHDTFRRSLWHKLFAQKRARRISGTRSEALPFSTHCWVTEFQSEPLSSLPNYVNGHEEQLINNGISILMECYRSYSYGIYFPFDEW